MIIWTDINLVRGKQDKLANVGGLPLRIRVVNYSNAQKEVELSCFQDDWKIILKQMVPNEDSLVTISACMQYAELMFGGSNKSSEEDYTVAITCQDKNKISIRSYLPDELITCSTSYPPESYFSMEAKNMAGYFCSLSLFIYPAKQVYDEYGIKPEDNGKKAYKVVSVIKIPKNNR